MILRVFSFNLNLDLQRMLRFRHDVRIGLFNTIDRMDLRDDDIGERPFILYADKDKNIRTAEAGVSLFHTGYAFQCADHVLGLSRFHFNENVSSRCHMTLPIIGCAICMELSEFHVSSFTSKAIP
jgi:hypothetical protein